MDNIYVNGSTSVIVQVLLRDSASAVAAGKTGLTYSNVTAYYCRPGGTSTVINLIAGGAGDSYSSGKFAEIDAAGMPGAYQVHLPAGCFAAGANSVLVYYSGSGFITQQQKVTLNLVDLRSVAGKVPATVAAGDSADCAASKAALVARTGTCQAGSTANTMVLDSGASATDDFYRYAVVNITGGTGVGQPARRVLKYVGLVQTVYVDTAWKVTPDNTTTFSIGGYAKDVTLLSSGRMQAGSSSGGILDALDGAADNVLKGAIIHARIGTGSGQTRTILSNANSTKLFTVDYPWTTVPDSTTIYELLCFDNYMTSGQFDSGVKLPATLATADVSGNIPANTVQWSGHNVPTPAIDGEPVVTLAGTQAAYAPAKAGDKMDIVDDPNATAVTALQATLLKVTTVLTELTVDPGASPQIGQAIELLYMALRNQETVTATARTIKNNANTTILTAPLSDDGTTFTKSKLS